MRISGLTGLHATLSFLWSSTANTADVNRCPSFHPFGLEALSPSCSIDDPYIEIPEGQLRFEHTGEHEKIASYSPRPSPSPSSRPPSEPFYEFLQPNRSLGTSLKHRYDFATFDSGARIVAAARTLKDVRAIQRPSTEAYMIGPCDEPAWVVVALPERISVEFLAFHFSELYSSYYSKIAILGASAYPTDQWRLLTLLSVEPAQPTNYFDLRPTCSKYNNPACWVTHLKFQVISYTPVSNSQICTLSRWQVFGSTLMQGLESKLKTAATSTQRPIEPDPPSPRPLRPETCPAEVTNNLFPIETEASKDRASSPRLITAAPSATSTQEHLSILRDARDEADGMPISDDAVNKWRSLYRHLVDSQGRQQTLRRLDTEITPTEAAVVLARDMPRPSQVMDTLTRLLNENLQASSSSFTRPPPPLRDGAPPLLALVDRVADIEKQVDAQTNLTLTRLSLVKEVIAGVSAMSESLETVVSVLGASLDRIVVHDMVSERLAQSDLGGRLLRLSCLKSLESFDFFDASSVRVQCVVAAYLTAGNTLLTSTTTASQFVNLLGSMQQFGLRQMINLKLQQLQAQLSFGAPDSRDFSAQEFVSANNAYKAGKLYLTFLRENHSLYGLREIQIVLTTLLYLIARALSIIQSFIWSLSALLGFEGVRQFDFISMAVTFPGFFQGWTSDPICLYLAVRIVELSAALSTWLLIKVSLFFLLLDCAIRTRENDTAIQTLANYLTMLEEDHANLTHPNNALLVRNAKTWSAASSSARGGLNKVLAGSLDLRKYIGPFRKRQRKQLSPRHATSSDESDEYSDLFGAPRKIYAATSCRSSPLSQEEMDPAEHPAAWSSPINRPSPAMRRSSTPLLSLFVRRPSPDSNDDCYEKSPQSESVID